VTDAFAGDPHSDWPDRTALYDHAGRLMLVFTLSEGTRSGRPWADGAWRPPGTPVAASRDSVLDALTGYAFSTGDIPLAKALVAAGARRIRHAHLMSHSLSSLPDVRLNPAVSVRPLPADELVADAKHVGAMNYRAYPPGHPDHEHEDVDSAVHEIRGIGLGEVLGPYLDVSCAAYANDALVGACLVVGREGVPPEGGPWIVDIFRDPDASVQGVGRTLLTGVLVAAHRACLPALSLAVSHENTRARALYTSLGFVDASQSWTLAVP
jgi:ribosomal protein S18 acetylase RimI-like enzyme